jgi:hypothetical protein
VTVIFHTLLKFLQALTLGLTLYKERKLREEGANSVRQAQLEEASIQQGEAHEIDLKVVRDGFSPADLERMRRYERTSK